MADPACFFLGCGSPPRYVVTYVEVGPKVSDCCGRHLSAAAEVALRRVPTCVVGDFDIQTWMRRNDGRISDGNMGP